MLSPEWRHGDPAAFHRAPLLPPGSPGLRHWSREAPGVPPAHTEWMVGNPILGAAPVTSETRREHSTSSPRGSMPPRGDTGLLEPSGGKNPGKSLGEGSVENKDNVLLESFFLSGLGWPRGPGQCGCDHLAFPWPGILGFLPACQPEPSVCILCSPRP